MSTCQKLIGYHRINYTSDLAALKAIKRKDSNNKQKLEKTKMGSQFVPPT